MFKIISNKLAYKTVLGGLGFVIGSGVVLYDQYHNNHLQKQTTKIQKYLFDDGRDFSVDDLKNKTSFKLKILESNINELDKINASPNLDLQKYFQTMNTISQVFGNIKLSESYFSEYDKIKTYLKNIFGISYTDNERILNDYKYTYYMKQLIDFGYPQLQTFKYLDDIEKILFQVNCELLDYDQSCKVHNLHIHDPYFWKFKDFIMKNPIRYKNIIKYLKDYYNLYEGKNTTQNLDNFSKFLLKQPPTK